MGVVDTYMAYKFIKILTTSWNKQPAFKLGLIDADGGRIRSPESNEEKDAYTHFDRLVFNVKRLINKAPGGKSTMASYGAALLLLKENFGAKLEDPNMFEYLTEKYKVDHKLNEGSNDPDMSLPFAVVFSGGSVGSKAKGPVDKKGRAVQWTFKTNDEAKQKAKRMNQILSPGEKKYYKMKYTAVALSENLNEGAHLKQVSPDMKKRFAVVMDKAHATTRYKDKQGRPVSDTFNSKSEAEKVAKQYNTAKPKPGFGAPSKHTTYIVVDLKEEASGPTNIASQANKKDMPLGKVQKRKPEEDEDIEKLKEEDDMEDEEVDEDSYNAGYEDGSDDADEECSTQCTENFIRECMLEIDEDHNLLIEENLDNIIRLSRGFSESRMPTRRSILKALELVTEGKIFRRVVRNKKVIRRAFCTSDNQHLEQGKCVANDAKHKKRQRVSVKKRKRTMRGKSLKKMFRKKAISDRKTKHLGNG